MSWGDVATWVGAGVAILFGGIAWWQASRAGKSARDSAAAATRSARADEQSAAAAVRSASAAERANELAESMVPPYSPRWELEPRGQHRYALINRTGETACAATASPADPDVMVPTEPIDVLRDESIVFLAALTLATADDAVTITWRRQKDPATPLSRTYSLGAA